MKQVKQGSPECIIQVEDDEFPHIRTGVIATDNYGQPALYTASGEQAGNNLMKYLEEKRYTINSITVTDMTILALNALSIKALTEAKV